MKNYGETFETLPADITDRSQQFIGWYSAVDGGEKLESTFLVPPKDTTYYGKWEPKQRTLTIDPNGGTYNGSSEITTLPMTDGSYTFLETPIREGYTFDGYTINGKGSYVESNTFPISYNGWDSVTEKEENGESYWNIKYYGDQEFSGNNWLAVNFPDFNYTLRNTYEIEFKVRINALQESLLEFRLASVNNDYFTIDRVSYIIHPEDAVIGEWKTIRMSRTLNAKSTTDGGTSSLYPHFEIYTGNLILRDVAIDFDIKDIIIRNIKADQLIQASRPTYASYYGDATLTANWIVDK